MNCVISSINVKVFSKALTALAKVGDELYIEAEKERLTLIALNSIKTVCSRIHLFDVFFTSYEVNLDDSDNDAVKCKIHIKALLALFKGNTVLEKKIEYMKIEYETSSEVITFKIKYKCGDVTTIQQLRLMEPESLTVQISPDSGSNTMAASSCFFNQLLSTFSNSEEIVLEVTKTKVLARNYLIGSTYRNKAVRSQVTLHSSEFSNYEISSETTINFSLKPLKTAIHFSEIFNLNLIFNFDKGGKPLCIIMKNPTFEFQLLVATSNPSNDTLTSTSSTSIVSKGVNENNVQLSQADREALQNENWDDLDGLIDVQSDKKQKSGSSKADSSKSTKTLSRNSSFMELMDAALMKKNKIQVLDDQIVESANKENKRIKLDLPADTTIIRKTKMIFKRCFEPTFNEAMFGEILAPNSDSE